MVPDTDDAGLARLDEVADLLRAVGPTLVVTVLLDGPHLTNR
jgi:hypothetical protein